MVEQRQGGRPAQRPDERAGPALGAGLRAFAVEARQRSAEISGMAEMSPDAHRSRRRSRRFAPVVCAGAFMAAIAVLVASTASARPGAVPDALASKAARQGPVRVIAGLAVAFTPEGQLPRPAGVAAQRAAIAVAQGRMLSRLAGSPHRVTRRFASIPFLALEVSAAALAALESQELVV